MTPKLVRSSKQARARRSRQLAVLSALEDQLVGAAISAGLCLERPRSLPSRVIEEARGFVRLLLTALRPRTDRVLERAALVEARTGAFAGAGADQAERVLALWRDTLGSIADGLPHVANRRELDAALARVRRCVLAACHRASADRVDYVLVGGSAGGIAAVGELLRSLGPWIAASLFVVLHTHPAAPGLMPLVLSRYTDLRISYPTDGGLPHLGHVYVAPPGRHLAIERGRLRVTDRPRVRFSRPSIDVLFESAAQSHGTRVASVVVSGTGSDGADGTLAVRRHGGVTLAQDPETAEFGAMPAAAVATGAVLRAAPAAELGALIVRLIEDGASALSTEAT